MNGTPLLTPRPDAPAGSTEDTRARDGARIPQWLGKLCFSVALIVVLLGLVEAGSFVVLRVASRRPTQVRKTYQPYVVWQGASYQGETITPGEGGTRRTFHSHCDDSDAYTIWMFGGSTMLGQGSPDEATIPSFLAERYEKAGKPACVLNYGQIAWVSTQETIKFILELKRATRKPNLVIFYDGYNDAFSLYQSGQIDTHHNLALIKHQFESGPAAGTRQSGSFHYLLESNTARLLEGVGEHLGSALHHGRFVGGHTSANADEQVRVAYLRNIDVVETLARQENFDSVFFWQPCILTGHKPLTPAEEVIRRQYDIADVFDQERARDDLYRPCPCGSTG